MDRTMKSIELFAGAGGMAMGTHLAGFHHEAVVEWDKWACDTIRENQRNGYPLVTGWPVYESDVRRVDFKKFEGQIDLITGGPPCQPFSMGGKHRAFLDPRDMFPAAIEVIRDVRPRAFIIENVKGLTRASFSSYFNYILLRLEFPTSVPKSNEPWFDHYERLVSEKSRGLRGLKSDVAYRVVPTLVNAANYGIPQKRERVFIVGFRSDLDATWVFPSATHSLDALLFQQCISGEYWKRHGIKGNHQSNLSRSQVRRIERLHSEPALEMKPWRTVRDALMDLPDPETPENSNYLNHRLQHGARTYPGHTGSPYDLPAKTLKAGAHGVPGGENMLVKDCGEVRYFTVRESARIQTFPDSYVFHGSWGESMRQLGNAVPVVLAQKVASSVLEQLIEIDLAKVANNKIYEKLQTVQSVGQG